MEMFLQIVMLIAGFVLLIKGADWLISGASSVAQNFKVSKMLIGLTIIAFGTGAPELAVSISSMISGNTDVLLGNVVGSNIVNVMLLLGVGAAIAPIIVKRNTVKKELPILLLISTILVVLFLDTSLNDATISKISRADAIVCILLFGVFIYYLVAMAKKKKNGKNEVEKPKWKLGTSFLITAIGLAGVVGGSQLVVNGATSIAQAFGVSEKMISLTIVAFGTSLPELVTTITASRRKEHDLLLGNIIGSNIFNICVVMALPILIGGSITATNFDPVDLIMLIFSALLVWLFTIKDHKITRKEGWAMLAIFALYYTYVIYVGITGVQIL
jgi:cation:H+ antiporter